MKPQTAAVLHLLRLRGSLGLTPRDALLELGCFRLAARVSEIRAAGYTVNSQIVPVRRAGHPTAHVARYRLIEAPEQFAAGF
jgi:helix-turn-helix protein